MDMLLITARGLLMPSPMCMVDTMDLVDPVVMADMDLDIVSTMDKQRISPHRWLSCPIQCGEILCLSI